MASSFGECFGSTRSRLVPELQAALEELGLKDPGPDMVETRRAKHAEWVMLLAKIPPAPLHPPSSPYACECSTAPRVLSLLSLLASTETDWHGERALTGTVERLCKQLIRDESMLVWMIRNDGLGWVILICAWTNLG